jgi:hypothetical protein
VAAKIWPQIATYQGDEEIAAGATV